MSGGKDTPPNDVFLNYQGLTGLGYHSNTHQNFDFFNLLFKYTGRVGENMENQELAIEIDRLKKEFESADENKIEVLKALIEQAAFETLYLRRLNEQAIVTGLVKIHPENPHRQQTLPISGEIAKHSAALTNIMDKLMKHLSVETNDDSEGLDDYE